MGNSFCCDNFDKNQQIVIQSDLKYESFEENENQIVKEKVIKNNINSNRNLKNDFSFQKTINTFTPKSADENDFINPLPEIVAIKIKKH